MKNFILTTGLIMLSVAFTAFHPNDVNAQTSMMMMFNDMFVPPNQLTNLDNALLEVPRFDGGLGTLEKVTVEFKDVDITTGGMVTNNAQQPQDATVTVTLNDFTVLATLGAPAVLAAPLPDPFPGAPQVVETEFYDDLAVGVPAPFGPTSILGVDFMFMTTAPLELAQFVGAGTFGYLSTTDVTQMTMSEGGNIDNTITTTASAMLKVTYEYEPESNGGPSEPSTTPEPSTFGMMAIALLAGLGFSSGASRRRRKR